MSFLGKFFKLARNANNRYDKYLKVTGERHGVLSCLALVPDNPEVKTFTYHCDSAILSTEGQEISREEYLRAFEEAV